MWRPLYSCGHCPNLPQITASTTTLCFAYRQSAVIYARLSIAPGKGSSVWRVCGGGGAWGCIQNELFGPAINRNAWSQRCWR